MRRSSPGAVCVLLFVVGLTAVGGMLVSSANAWEFGPGANVADAPDFHTAPLRQLKKRIVGGPSDGRRLQPQLQSGPAIFR